VTSIDCGGDRLAAGSSCGSAFAESNSASRAQSAVCRAVSWSENSIIKPPSAELRPGQLDSESLPDYALLDPLLHDYVEQDLGAAELIATGHDPALVEKVIKLVDRAGGDDLPNLHLLVKAGDVAGRPYRAHRQVARAGRRATPPLPSDRAAAQASRLG